MFSDKKMERLESSRVQKKPATLNSGVFILKPNSSNLFRAYCHQKRELIQVWSSTIKFIKKEEF